MDSKTRIKFEPRQRYKTINILRYQQTPQKNKTRKWSAKNIHNPIIHKSTFPLQQQKI